MNDVTQAKYDEIANRLVALGFSHYNRVLDGRNFRQLEDTYAVRRKGSVEFTVRFPRAWQNFSAKRRHETGGVMIPRLLIEVEGRKGRCNRRSSEAQLMVDPAKENWWVGIEAWIEKQVPLAITRREEEELRQKKTEALYERSQALDSTMRDLIRNLRAFGKGSVIHGDEIVGYRIEIDVVGTDPVALPDKINRMLAIANA